jgi:hypothetical protein
MNTASIDADAKARMTRSGWRRTGLFLSVIWFFGFGLFLWHRIRDQMPEPYAQQRQLCGVLLDDWNQALKNVRPANEYKAQIANIERYRKCLDDAQGRFERELSELPSARTQTATVLGLDLLIICLGWLIVWGCIAVVRRIRRRFIPQGGAG